MKLLLLAATGLRQNLCQALFNIISPPDKEIDMDIQEEVKYHGYPILTYTVVTSDGYRLEMHRLPGSRYETPLEAMKKAKERQSVLVLHGIDSSSYHMVMAGPGREGEDGLVHGKAIPYQLVDTGNFDVWLFNARGNKYSRHHLWLHPDSEPDFWDFSFEEMAQKDVPACLDFIQNQRNDKRKITMIGFSQGTTVSTFGLATFPNYFDKKVNLFVAITPAIQFKFSKEPDILAATNLIWLGEQAMKLDYVEFDGPNRGNKDDLTT